MNPSDLITFIVIIGVVVTVTLLVLLLWRQHHMLSNQREQQGQQGRDLSAQLANQERALTGLMSEQLTRLRERLAVLDETQRHMQGLQSTISSLQQVLNNKQARGAFGEVLLLDTLKTVLPPSAYSLQHSLPNGTRADCLLLLPNPPGSIALDAKFPLAGFREFHSATDAAARDSAASQIRQVVQKHLKDIASKYIVPGATADAAIMFVPAEAVYLTIITDFPEMLEKAAAMRVWLASPATLIAVLLTVRALLKDAQVAQNLHSIQTDISRLLQQIDAFHKSFADTAKKIRQAGEALDEFDRRADKLKSQRQSLEDSLLTFAAPPNEQ